MSSRRRSCARTRRSCPRVTDAAEPEPDRTIAPPSTRRFSRRSIIAAALVALAFAVVALVTGIAVLRSSDASGAGISPGSVGVVDPASKRVVTEIPVGFRSPLIAAGEGFVWVVDSKAKTLTKIDPETNAIFTPAQRIPAPGIPIGLAAGEGSVWIALNEGRALSVIEVNPESGDRRDRIVLEDESRSVPRLARSRSASRSAVGPSGRSSGAAASSTGSTR